MSQTNRSGPGREHDGGEEEALLGGGEEDQSTAAAVRSTVSNGAKRGSKRVKRAWEGFVDFLFQDHVIEVALGLIIASQFTSLLNSFVSDVVLPPLSLLPGVGRNFNEKFAVLRSGSGKGNGTSGGDDGWTYNTVKQARDDGAIVLVWGAFVDQVVNFFVVGLALYVLAQAYSWASEDNVIKRTVKCRFCRKRVSEKAKRCFNCTSWLDGRDDGS